MKASCLVLAGLILIAIMAVCVMVKFATEINVEEKNLDSISGLNVFQFSKSMGVISLNEHASLTASERFPYVAAITRNSSASWSFACFASVVLVKWVVTSAHCRRAGAAHRALLYHDYVRNHSQAYPVLFWRIHEKFNITLPTPLYDIAVAKLDLDPAPFPRRSSTFDAALARRVEASVWKTVSTMDKRIFLTDDFENLQVTIAPHGKCYESYGVFLDESMICVDVSGHDDCFVYEFGPLYTENKVVGVIAVKPRDCDVKIAVFTNVSYYTNWILKATRTALRG